MSEKRITEFLVHCACSTGFKGTEINFRCGHVYINLVSNDGFDVIELIFKEDNWKREYFKYLIDYATYSFDMFCDSFHDAYNEILKENS